jgi:hypothetical protein
MAANDTVSVGKGNDTFIFQAAETPTVAAPATLSVNAGGAIALPIAIGNGGFGHDMITGFSASQDKIQFDTAQFASFAAVTAHASQSGSDMVIAYDANDSVTLKGVSLSSLAAKNFSFVTSSPASAETITISGIPADVTLSDTAGPLTVTNGSITLTPAQLAGLTLHAGTTSATLTVTLTGGSGVTATSVSQTIALNVSATGPMLTTPTISGTAQEGATLTAAATSSDPITYAWYSSASGYTTAIGTGASYVLKEGDEGFTIEVIATATRNGVTVTKTSAATSAVIDAAPSINVSINGTAQEGQTLTAVVTGAETDDGLKYAWTSSANPNVVLGTASTYLVQESDEGSTITVKVTATTEDLSGSTTRSASSGTVIDAAPSINVSINGTAQEGQTLTAVVTGAESDDGLSYQWISSNGNAVLGTASTYLVQESDEGSTITLKVTATTEDLSGSITKNATTGTVLDAAPTVTTPTISGTAQEGQTLTASASSGQGDNPVTYAWYSSKDNYTTAVGSGTTYQVQDGDEGFTIKVKATATNDNSATASATSPATSAVLDAAPTITTPTITGTAQEGATLTASASSGQNDNPVTNAWYSSADGYTSPIGTGATYLAKEGDEGFTIEVKATATNDNGVTVFATSAATSTVLDAAPTITTPTISGTAQEGQTLTASASSGQGDNPVTYAWYSSANGYTTAIGSGATYQVKESDEGFTIEVNATATNENGATATATSAATSAVLDAAPTITPPTISGMAQEGRTLTASASSGQLDNLVTYAWYSSGDGYTTAIGTGAAYQVKEGDEGFTIEVKATATNDNGATASATSAATSAVLDAAPTITTPTISGTVQEGATLTASASSGQGDNPVSYAWYSSADGFTNAIGTGSTYQVKEGDEGFTIEVKATATNENNATAIATSAATSAVLDAAPTITTPTITGTAQEGQTLTASASSGQSDNPVSYAWYSSADNYANPIGTGATYLVQESDEGSTIKVRATATNENSATASATSAATSAVLDAASTITTPTISGTAQEGATLPASASSGQGDNAVSYAWYSSADGYTNPIGSGATYQVKEGDEGFTIEVKATATNESGATATAASAATSAVLDAAPTITTPTISGTAQEGQTLTASASSGQGDNPVTYAWYSSGYGYTTAIGTGATYQVKEGDEGFTIEVKATATNDNGATASATSAATSAVLDAAPTITTPTISGTVQEGATLTASASSGQGDNPVSYAWYSSADGFTNAIGTGSTYQVKEGDEGFTIEVKVTATNDNGATASATSAATSVVLDAARRSPRRRPAARCRKGPL